MLNNKNEIISKSPENDNPQQNQKLLDHYSVQLEKLKTMEKSELEIFTKNMHDIHSGIKEKKVTIANENLAVKTQRDKLFSLHLMYKLGEMDNDDLMIMKNMQLYRAIIFFTGIGIGVTNFVLRYRQGFNRGVTREFVSVQFPIITGQAMGQAWYKNTVDGLFEKYENTFNL